MPALSRTRTILATAAKFSELGAGIYISTVAPEDAAAALRD